MSDATKLSTIEEAIEEFKAGNFIIVVDDEDRENEGDFIIAAEKITPEKVNFMLKEGRGVLCAPITMQRCSELGLDKQVITNTSLLGTPFTITIDKIDRLFHRRIYSRPRRNNPRIGRSGFNARDIRQTGTYQPSLCTR